MNNQQNKKAMKKSKTNKQNGKVSVPAAMSRISKTGVPKMNSSNYASDGRIRITHREYIGEVVGSVAFGSTAYAVNPGNGTTFPWLSRIAPQYESYLIKKLSFEFETQKGSATVGSVMLAMDFDAADSAPLNKIDVMSYHNAVRSAVWSPCCFTADLRDLQKFGVQRYIRSGALSANQDIKTYDVGNLYVSTQGCADTSAIGELYVVYDMELITPQLDISGLALAKSAKIVGAGTVNLANVFGTVSGTITGGLPLTAVGGTITFGAVGQYIINLYAAGTVFASAPGITGTATTTVANTVWDAAATGLVTEVLVRVNNVGETMVVDFTGHAATVSGSTTRIAPYNYPLQ